MAEPFDPLAFLVSLDGFQGWRDDPALDKSLINLASRVQVWTFREGDLVRFPDEASPGPTWVAEGCLVVLEAQAPRYVGIREPLVAPSGVWIRGQTAGRFIVIAEASWSQWLRQYPTAAERLGETPPPALPRGLGHSPLVLEPGEVPVQIFRKALPFLALRAALPAAFFLSFLAFGLVLQFALTTSAPGWVLWFVPGLGMAITSGLVALVAWEWSVSVLAVTDRSILIRQVDVWSHRSDFEKLALERIREAVFRREGWFDTLMGLVNVEIEGDSPKGRLVFRGLAHDSRFLEAMEGLRLKRKAGGPGRSAIRQALADRAGGARSPKLEQEATDRSGDAPKAGRLSWRTETAGTIWFRRHPWAAAKKSAGWFGWFALAVFLGALAVAMAPQAWPVEVSVTLLVALFPLGRIAWNFWDWADDRLSIQGDKIVLIHRRPLWLGEIRQEGSLEQVQQVGVRKESLTALLLDYGLVTISLGGGSPLEFESAAHPEWVQNEIFYRRTLLAQDRDHRESRDRLDQVSEILDTWDQARRAGYFNEP